MRQSLARAGIRKLNQRMKRLCASLGTLIGSGVLVVSLAACGEDEEDKFRNEESFCTQWAIEACNTSIIENCSEDEAECEAAQKTYCMSKVPRDTYVNNGAEECVNAAADALVDARLDAEERDIYVNFGGPCAKVISGDGSAGDSCEQTRDCSTSEELECVKKPGQAEGECHVPELIEPGEQCGNADQICTDGYFCDADAESCLAEKKEDSTCALARPCREGFKCVDADGAVVGEAEVEGTCVAKAANGDDCDTNADCVTDICAPNGSCVRQIDISGSSVFDLCDDFRE